MSPALAFLIAEMIKITIDRVAVMGKYTTLSEDEAKASIAQFSESLKTVLPTPEELENGV